MEGACHNAYLQQKSGFDYQETKLQIEKESGKKKSNSQKILTLLHKLTFFKLDISLIPYLLSYLDNEDKKVVRLVYYIFGELAEAHNSRDKYLTEILKRIKDDIQSSQLRGVCSIKAFSEYKSNMTGKLIIADFVRNSLKSDETKQVSSSDSKKKEKSKVIKRRKSRGENDEDSDYCLEATYLFELRTQLKSYITKSFFQTSLMDYLMSDDPKISYNALGIAHYFSTKDPVCAAETLYEKVGLDDAKDESDRINVPDVRSQVLLCKICGTLIEYHENFRKQVHIFLQENDPRLHFAAIEALIHDDESGDGSEWSYIEKSTILSKGKNFGKPILESILKRIEAALVGDEDLPTVHTACRMTRQLAKMYMLHFTKNEGKTTTNKNVKENHPLYSLYSKLASMLTKSSPFIRIRILQTLIWFYHADQVDELETIILNVIGSLPSELFNIISEELCTRVKVNPSGFSDAVLHLFHRIFEENPTKLNPEMLMGMWNTVMEFGFEGQVKVLQNIFTFLSTPPNISHWDSINHITQIIYWYLGQNANVLVGDIQPPSLPTSNSSNSSNLPQLQNSKPEKPSPNNSRKTGRSKSVSKKTSGKVLNHQNSKDNMIRDDSKKSLQKSSSKIKQSSDGTINEDSKEDMNDSTPSSSSSNVKTEEKASVVTIEEKNPKLIQSTSANSVKDTPIKRDTSDKDVRTTDKKPSNRRKSLNSLIKSQINTSSTSKLKPHSSVSGTPTLTTSSTVAEFPISPQSLSLSIAQRGDIDDNRNNDIWAPLTVRGSQKDKVPSSNTGKNTGMSNPLMCAVLARLEYAVGFACWEVRIICLEALAKIGFLSGFDVKLHLYSFLQNVLQDNGVALSSYVIPVLSTLHNVFAAYSDHITNGGNMSPTKKAELIESIKQYCDVPQGYHPLGITEK
eukprot:TRINITY_DN5433_c0_g1_i1.p1 TRINITY_DN5433_c0_g1~~TRINITY_DN5433_c0_g1_i1.p1  ORF type:complete len:910 (+),score=209.21 TRINITY_DN5433_c0_g1_i1:106-2835(+)